MEMGFDVVMNVNDVGRFDIQNVLEVTLRVHVLAASAHAGVGITIGKGKHEFGNVVSIDSARPEFRVLRPPVVSSNDHRYFVAAGDQFCRCIEEQSFGSPVDCRKCVHEKNLHALTP